MSRFAANFAAAGQAVAYYHGEPVRWFSGGTGEAIEITAVVERSSATDRDDDLVEAFAGQVVVRVTLADVPALLASNQAGIRDHVEVAVVAGSPAYARYVVTSRADDAAGHAAFSAAAMEPEQRVAHGVRR